MPPKSMPKSDDDVMVVGGQASPRHGCLNSHGTADPKTRTSPHVTNAIDTRENRALCLCCSRSSTIDRRNVCFTGQPARAIESIDARRELTK